MPDHVDAPCEVVFDVLLDPTSFAIWVVGSKHIRGVDAEGPQPGSKLYHIVGWGLSRTTGTLKTWLETLERGRSSFDRHVWGDAYAQLSAADGEEPLRPEDLQRLAVAAYLVGRDDVSAEAWERAHLGS